MAQTDDPTTCHGTYAPEEAAAAATTKIHHHNTRPPRKQVEKESDEGSGENFDAVSDPEEVEYDDDYDGGGKLPATKDPPLLSTQNQQHKRRPQQKMKQTPYSGLSQAARALLNSEDHDDLLADDLRFQRNPGGEAVVFKTYKADVLQHSGLVVFAFMRPGSASIHLIHSPQTYVTHRNDDDLKGKDIAFVGDRTHLNPSPPAIVLSEKSSWNWITKPFHLDQTAMEPFYANDENKYKLWNPPPNTKKIKPTSFPRLLFLPTAFIPYCAEQPRTPFEFYQHVIHYITTTDTAIPLEDCKRVLNWCLAATHSDTGGNNSWLAYQIEAAISNNPRFYKWTHSRLINIFGELPGALQSYHTVDGMDWSTMGQQLRAGIVEGLHPMLMAKKADELVTPAPTPNKGKEYDEQQWYMLMELMSSRHPIRPDQSPIRTSKWRVSCYYGW